MNPTSVTMKTTIGEEGNKKPPHKVHLCRKSQSPFLVSTKLEIKYAMHFFLNMVWFLSKSDFWRNKQYLGIFFQVLL